MLPIIARLFSLLFTCSLLFSCASNKDVLYLQDIEDYSNSSSNSINQIRFKKNDEILINISSSDNKSAMPFNLPLVAGSGSLQVQALPTLQTYLVGQDGSIQFPILGEISVIGLTKRELREKIHNKIKKYVKDPIINIRITNFNISVLGEVRKPGMYPVPNERVSVMDALSLAGDMSIYGKRKELLIVRENQNSKKEYYKIDLTSSAIFNSDSYYLQQNDILIVNPNDAQVQSSVFNRNTPIYVSIASLLLSMLTIFSIR